MQQALRTIGMWTDSPLFGAQMQTTLGNFWNWLDGTSEMELRDLVFAKKKKRREAGRPGG